MKNPPDGWPRIAPAVFYHDAAAAIDWLARAFGFTVRVKVENDKGLIVHSQLALNGGLIMVGQVGLRPERTYPQSPLAVGGANTQSLAVYVDRRGWVAPGTGVDRRPEQPSGSCGGPPHVARRARDTVRDGCRLGG